MSDTAPTLILTGGQVLTVDRDFTVAQGVAVRGRDIVAVGTDAEMRALAGSATRLVELDGRTVLPGINDSHLHGAAYGMTKPPFALDTGHPAVGSIADIAALVGGAVGATPPGEWITGLGWDPGYLAECLAEQGRFPHRRDLDAVAPDHPVCLTDFSSHMVWANTAALRACGIDRDTVAPPGGVIDRGPDGEPTGILREAAQRLVQAALPSPTTAQRRQAIQGVIRELHSVADAAGLDRFPLLGVSQGGAVAVAYATRRPERVSRLILTAAYARGQLIRAGSDAELDAAEVDLNIARAGWRSQDSSFLRYVASQFLADATPAEWDAFAAYQRQTTSPANGLRFLEEFARIDVSGIAHQVTCPTLIIHSRDDARVPVAQALELATLIPDSRLILLESRNHLFTADDPAWPTFLSHLDNFLAE